MVCHYNSFSILKLGLVPMYVYRQKKNSECVLLIDSANGLDTPAADNCCNKGCNGTLRGKFIPLKVMKVFCWVFFASHSLRFLLKCLKTLDGAQYQSKVLCVSRGTSFL